MQSALTSLLLTASAASAHYNINSIQGEAEWAAVRRVNSFQSSAPVEDTTSDNLRCNQQDPANATVELAAGEKVTVSFSESIYHPGPVQSYLARVPDGQDITTFDPSTEAVWFKIHQDVPGGLGGDELKWPSMNQQDIPITIPSCIPAGDYLMRNEQVALQLAQATNGAQFFLSCAQIRVTGGGSTQPADLVSFPGAYKADDPGILINVNNPVPTSYTNPGPAPFAC